jgi:hypothetical protein
LLSRAAATLDTRLNVSGSSITATGSMLKVLATATEALNRGSS